MGVVSGGGVGFGGLGMGGWGVGGGLLFCTVDNGSCAEYALLFIL